MSTSRRHPCLIAGLAAAVTVSAAAMTGCHAAGIDPVLPKRFVLQTLKTTPVDGGTHLLPLDPGTRRYLVVEGGEKGKTVTEKLSKDESDKSAPYRLHRPQPRIEHLAVNDNGDIVLTAIEDLDHDVIAQFDPPLPRVPAHLKPGFSVTTKSKATVRGRKHPDNVEYTGEVTEKLEYVDRLKVRALAGKYDAVHLHSKMSVDFGVASVSTSDDRYLAPGKGMVAEGFGEHVEVFFFIRWNKKRVMVLESGPDGPDTGGKQD